MALDTLQMHWRGDRYAIERCIFLADKCVKIWTTFPTKYVLGNKTEQVAWRVSIAKAGWRERDRAGGTGDYIGLGFMW